MSYLGTWRGAVVAVLAVAAVFAVGIVDFGVAAQLAGVLGVVAALVVLLSSAARSGPVVAVAPQAAAVAEPAPTHLEPGASPLVSVIVPFYDDERFIETCLESVLGQDYANWEMVAVDDCGSDGSAALVERMAAAEPRIRLVSHDRNRGLAASRNTGIAHSRGDYLVFLDADDFLLAGSLSRRVAAALLQRDDPEVAGSFCGWQLVPEDATIDTPINATPRDRTVDFLVANGENPFIATAPLIRRDVVLAARGFDEEFRTAEDFDFWMRVLRQGYRFVPAGMVGVAYRQKRMGMISEGPAHHARNARQIYDFLDRPLWREEAAPGAPDPFPLPLGQYQRDLQWLGRLASFVFFALAHGDRQQVDELLAMVPPTANARVLFHGSVVEEAIDAAVRRWNLKSGSLPPDREARARTETAGLLLERVEQAGATGAAALEPAPPGAPLRRGSLDETAARRRARVVGGTVASEPAGADTWLLVLTRPPEPPPLRARRAAKQLVVAANPHVVVNGEAREVLDGLATDVTYVRARRPSTPAELAELAYLAAGLPADFVVLADRVPATTQPGQTESEQQLRAALTAPPETGSPVTLLAVDGPGQLAALAAAAGDAAETRVLDLGPLADPVPPVAASPPALSPAGVLHPDLDVARLLAVYPYGPQVSALIDALAESHIPSATVQSQQAVDWLDDAAAARPGAGGNGSPDRRWKERVREAWVGTNRREARRRDGVLASEPGVPVSAFRDKHRGERCFVIGNGPSLNDLDLARMRSDASFGVNGIFLAEESMGFPVTYYMVEDDIYMKENVPEIVDYGAGHKFFPSEYVKYFATVPPNVSFFEMDGRYYQRSSPLYCVPRFSTDFSLRGYCGQSVTILNLQLAYYMGFTEVIMIGMDFSYTIPSSVVRDGNHLLSTEDDPNHFHPDYFGKGRTWKDPKLDRVLASYQLAKRVFEEDGRRIVNATAGGKLELFDRVDYDSLF